MAADFPTTYYARTLSNCDRFPVLDRDLSTDVCVVGGGYAGLMTQLGLLERGVRHVALLENRRVGWGASGRNGGFVFAGYSLAPEKLLQRVGRDHARELYQLTVDAVELIRRRVTEFSIVCDVVERGVIWANWFKDQQILWAAQNFMRRQFDVDWEYLPPAELYQKIRSQRYCGGLWERNAMHFHPLNYALGIAARNIRLGGEIFEDSAVLAIKKGKGEISVLTAQGVVRCQRVVICAGGYIAHLAPRVSRAILPIATYIVVTEALPDNCAGHLFTDAAVYDNRFAFDYYRRLRDARLLWGGRISASTRRPHNLREQLRRDMTRVFPGLAEVAIDYAWDGWMAYARHQMPCLGHLGDGIWYNIGFGGHGVGPTTAAGELIAAAIAEGDDRYRLFQPWGLPWSGGLLGALAAQATYWWYQGKDWAKRMR